MLKKAFLILLILLIIPTLLISNEKDEIETIKKYYGIFGTLGTTSIYEELKEAYEMSPKNVPFYKYLEWYENVLGANVYNIKKIDNHQYEFFVLIQEAIPNTGTFFYSAFFVTMNVKENKILKSVSKQINNFQQYKLKYDNNHEIIVENFPEINSIDFYLYNKKSSKKSMLFNLQYRSHHDANLINFKIENNLLIFESNNMSEETLYNYDFKTKRLLYKRKSRYQ